MQQKYSQRIEMQIPKENSYTGLELKKSFDDKFKKLSKNYLITNEKK